MELKDTVKLTLDKGTQRVKCYKFKIKEFKNRELAAHAHTDYKACSTITDVKTGLRLFTIYKDIAKVTDGDIKEGLDTFVKHFTLEEILKRFKELDEIEENKERK